MVELLVLAVVGVLTGALNSVSGGGSLISYPALLALGYPPLVANVTNTVALPPNYVGSALGYRREMVGQGRRLAVLGAACALGGAVGGVALLALPEAVFDAVVPWLLLMASLLVLVQPRLGRWFGERLQGGPGAAAPLGSRPAVLIPATVFVAVYGGYFGAAAGVVFVGVLGVLVPDSLQRLNALRIGLTFVVNGVAALIYAVFAPVVWSAAVTLAVSLLLGGLVGTAVARRLPDPVLRGVVVAVGVTAAVYSAIP